MLIIFYDGACPLCAKEMQSLKRHDVNNRICLEDVHQSDFEKRFPNIRIEQALSILHGQYNGELLYGLDVTYRAWSLVGKKWRVAWLRWPVIRYFADKAYLFFAKHRMKISSLFTSKRCNNDTCSR